MGTAHDLGVARMEGISCGAGQAQLTSQVLQVQNCNPQSLTPCGGECTSHTPKVTSNNLELNQ